MCEAGTAHKGEIWGSKRRGNELFLSGGEIVEAGNDMTVRQQTVNKITANESGAACDEVMHHASISLLLFLRICTQGNRSFVEHFINQRAKLGSLGEYIH